MRKQFKQTIMDLAVDDDNIVLIFGDVSVYLFKEFKEVNQQSYKVNYRRAIYMNLIVPSIRMISAVCYIFTIYYGGNLLLNGLLDPSDLYLFTRSLWNLFFPIFQVAAFWPQFQTGLASFERSLALIDSKPQVVQNDQSLDPLRFLTIPS